MLKTSNHKSVGAELTSVISILLLLSGPSLLAGVQHVKMFWSRSTIRSSHYVDICSFSSMATERAEKGQLGSSLHQVAKTLHRPRWNALPCGAATLAPLLSNLRVKISTAFPFTSGMDWEDEMFAKLSTHVRDHQAGLSLFWSSDFFYCYSTCLEYITSPPACPVICSPSYTRSPLLLSCKAEGFLEVQHVQLPAY